MSFFVKIIFLHFILFNSSSNFEKQIQKLIDKEWKKLEIKKIKIEQNELKTFFSLYHKKELKGYLVISKTNGCHINGCNILTRSSKYETFYYAILFNNIKKIRAIKILEYESEYGYEICNRRWLNQFKNTNGCENIYGKNIDAISGATISGENITMDIQNICKKLSTLTR